MFIASTLLFYIGTSRFHVERFTFASPTPDLSITDDSVHLPANSRDSTKASMRSARPAEDFRVSVSKFRRGRYAPCAGDSIMSIYVPNLPILGGESERDGRKKKGA